MSDLSFYGGLQTEKELASYVYVSCSAVRLAAQISTCMRFEGWMAGIYTIAISFTSLLFTLRVRAIFKGDKCVTTFFGFLWLVVVGTAAMTTQSVTVVRIGSTGYCISEHVAGYVTSAAVAPLVNDTLVFLAISWRLMQNSVVGEKHRFRLRAMILGQRMPSLSHALLKDGQIYYL
ncbi:hypothetical protein JR316_0009942 [Psilocybe cubensis]|uniref:Uncharacterized protein n=1 Tax=Psilocybe cubensis TaxID=181762 RepID=A0ACB8GR67_PSICU|nr:hypothetical protein JR316_0009942 [Psilocybe cubensis]KAH9477716.1 hypothetical protein JR316_0009942 [Psilocybe cubensis]